MEMIGGAVQEHRCLKEGEAASLVISFISVAMPPPPPQRGEGEGAAGEGFPERGPTEQQWFLGPGEGAC